MDKAAFDRELESALPALRKFAHLQLRNPALAEDAVQEVCGVAVEKWDSFQGGAQVKTWLIAILKNKVIDLIRSEARRGAVEVSVPASIDDDLFDARGHWTEEFRPSDWGDPQRALESQRFWEVFEVCMTRLPDRLAQIFSANEMLGMTSVEICKEFQITSSNYWVLMHRARGQLRLCLETRWVKEELG